MQGRHPRSTAGIELARALAYLREGVELTLLDRDREALARAAAYTVDGGRCSTKPRRRRWRDPGRGGNIHPA
jgi:hypothetical protein